MIADPHLRALASDKLRVEHFNAEVAATLATLVPEAHRERTVEAIVALEVMYDYLDGLTEQPADDPLENGWHLYRAFTTVFDRGPEGVWKGTGHNAGDGDYLAELSSTVRMAIATLPGSSAVRIAGKRAAERCAVGQIRVHAAPQIGVCQLEQWAMGAKADGTLGWREYVAGAVASVLAVHALIVAGAEASTTEQEAEAVDAAYLSISAVSTMLDSLVDYERDVAIGDPWLVRLYDGDAHLLADRLLGVAEGFDRARSTPAPQRTPPDDADGRRGLLHLCTGGTQRAGAPGRGATSQRAAAEHPANAGRDARLASGQASSTPCKKHGCEGKEMNASGDDKSGRPRYVAIITDGNGRWARTRGLAANVGHEAGADTLRERVADAAELGVRELTVYSFSTENWSRPKAEVAGLIEILACRIARETPELHAQGVRMRFIGSRQGVPEGLVTQMRWAEALTTDNHRLSLYVAFNYGARSEIVEAAADLKGGSEADFRACLYAPEMHDPELVIRTGGEQRLSNYLLWQAAYSELVFREELWPDFSREALEDCVGAFQARRRRFGGR